MPTVEEPGTYENPGPLRRWSAEEPFWRRHLLPPSPWAAIGVAVVLVVGIALAGAAIWTGSDSAVIRRSGSTVVTGVPATEAPAAETTTTKPDLSVETLQKKVAPLVWSISTLDPSGQPAVASAFVVGSVGGQSFLVTSLAAVEASIQAPGPVITATNGTFNGPAALWTWDDSRDLALLAVSRSHADQIPWAEGNPMPKANDRVFALGSGDAKVSPGILTGVSGSRDQHNIFIDDQRRGGPIVDIKGDVVAVSSAAFTGGGTPTDAAFFGVPIHALCEAMIRCGGANAPQSDTAGSSSTTSGTGPSSSSTTRRSTTTTEATEETATSEA